MIKSYSTGKGICWKSGWLPCTLHIRKKKVKDQKNSNWQREMKPFLCFAYVGVSSRLELLYSTVRSNVFNAVSKGSFVL